MDLIYFAEIIIIKENWNAVALLSQLPDTSTRTKGAERFVNESLSDWVYLMIHQEILVCMFVCGRC